MAEMGMPTSLLVVGSLRWRLLLMPMANMETRLRLTAQVGPRGTLYGALDLLCRITDMQGVLDKAPGMSHTRRTTRGQCRSTDVLALEVERTGGSDRRITCSRGTTRIRNEEWEYRRTVRITTPVLMCRFCRPLGPQRHRVMWSRGQCRITDVLAP